MAKKHRRECDTCVHRRKDISEFPCYLDHDGRHYRKARLGDPVGWKLWKDRGMKWPSFCPPLDCRWWATCDGRMLVIDNIDSLEMVEMAACCSITYGLPGCSHTGENTPAPFDAQTRAMED